MDDLIKVVARHRRWTSERFVRMDPRLRALLVAFWSVAARRIAAAKADGHVISDDSGRIFDRVGEVEPDAESKAFISDALAASVGISEVAALVTAPEHATELYLTSRPAVEPDGPAELAYLEALAHRLKLPEDRLAHLNRQADSV